MSVNIVAKHFSTISLWLHCTVVLSPEYPITAGYGRIHVFQRYRPSFEGQSSVPEKTSKCNYVSRSPGRQNVAELRPIRNQYSYNHRTSASPHNRYNIHWESWICSEVPYLTTFMFIKKLSHVSRHLVAFFSTTTSIFMLSTSVDCPPIHQAVSKKTKREYNIVKLSPNTLSTISCFQLLSTKSTYKTFVWPRTKTLSQGTMHWDWTWNHVFEKQSSYHIVTPAPIDTVNPSTYL